MLETSICFVSERKKKNIRSWSVGISLNIHTAVKTPACVSWHTKIKPRDQGAHIMHMMAAGASTANVSLTVLSTLACLCNITLSAPITAKAQHRVK